MPNTRGTVTAVLVGALLSLALPGEAGAQGRSHSAGPRYHEYVALGDSWSADVFTSLPTSEFVPIDCAQSPTNYPHQVAARLKVPVFRDATCGSATSEHFVEAQSLPLGGVNPPQFDMLRKTTDLVTVGIGGNDIGLADAVLGCLNLLPADLLGLPAPLGAPCSNAFSTGDKDRFREAIKVTEPKLRMRLRQIHRRSPRADIFLVNYLNGLPTSGKGCWPIVPITDADMAYLQRTFLLLNAMLERVAKADKHTRLINTYTPTLGHDLCQPSGTKYAEGLIPLALDNPLLLAIPFHPNQRGADAQARIVTRSISRN
ncbi:SGNH/GDSL hydrolase family protein [Nocardioides humilatus]|uniref:SGNH/GDSL hydrolase family protein n=1 Tax=Nocardioides humilatus TaxID=2607660 RepID=A0A5B1L626_9ACTN|nr:SGNH/GDSL hydrolase family protein [Nocardioides humilatus]KAA1415965.1 SGNH/GDSL hydrolase family protein [Nocardioides humilatus]